MTAFLREALQNGSTLWSGLGRGQQFLVLVVAVLLPVLILLGTQWMAADSYVPLFAGLGPEETGAILAQLKAAKAPYRLQNDQVLVPADRVGELRLRVASQGLPIGGGVGFEVFDRTTLGVSDFTQRLNYQRALQGELARTIGQLRGVARARVHLVLPQPSLFAERERPASASVFLKLAPGARLSADQVRGIVHLVASSVEGLSPERVTVLDTAGRMLMAAVDGGSAAGLSPRRLEIKTAVEEGLERRVQTLLDSVLGPGQAVTRVSAQINFDQVERTEERFDPTPVVRQETRTVETSKASSAAPVIGAAPAPAPGAAGAPAGAPPASTTANDGNRESETVNYEISKVVARTLTSPGEVQRVSVAVLLNAPGKPANGSPGAAPATRSAGELEKIRRVVMGAVGYNQARGDEVTVVEMPFDTSVLERERTALDLADEPGVRLPGGMAGQLAAAVAAGVVVAGILLFLTRRRSRARALDAVTRTLEGTRGAGAAPAGGGLPTDALDDADEPAVPDEYVRLGRERKGLRQRAVALAQAEPEATAQLLRAWMVKRRARAVPAASTDG